MEGPRRRSEWPPEVLVPPAWRAWRGHAEAAVHAATGPPSLGKGSKPYPNPFIPQEMPGEAGLRVTDQMSRAGPGDRGPEVTVGFFGPFPKPQCPSRCVGIEQVWARFRAGLRWRYLSAATAMPGLWWAGSAPQLPPMRWLGPFSGAQPLLMYPSQGQPNESH